MGSWALSFHDIEDVLSTFTHNEAVTGAWWELLASDDTLVLAGILILDKEGIEDRHVIVSVTLEPDSMEFRELKDSLSEISSFSAYARAEGRTLFDDRWSTS